MGSEIREESQSLRTWNLAMNYLIKGAPKISLDNLANTLQKIPIQGGKDTMPTIAETLLAQGREEGREERKKEEKQERQRWERKKMLQMVLSMQKKGCDVAFISDITKLDEAFLLRFLTTAKRMGLVE